MYCLVAKFATLVRHVSVRGSLCLSLKMVHVMSCTTYHVMYDMSCMTCCFTSQIKRIVTKRPIYAQMLAVSLFCFCLIVVDVCVGGGGGCNHLCICVFSLSVPKCAFVFFIIPNSHWLSIGRLHLFCLNAFKVNAFWLSLAFNSVLELNFYMYFA